MLCFENQMFIKGNSIRLIYLQSRLSQTNCFKKQNQKNRMLLVYLINTFLYLIYVLLTLQNHTVGNQNF